MTTNTGLPMTPIRRPLWVEAISRSSSSRGKSMVRSVAAFAALVVAATRVGAQKPPAHTPAISLDSADFLEGKVRAASDEGSADSQVRALKLFLRSAQLYRQRNAHVQEAEALAYAA